MTDAGLEKLQAELLDAYTHFIRVVHQLAPDQHCQSGVSGHWSPKDVLSHLTGWDQSFQAFIADPDGFNPAPLYDVDAFNAKSVSERQHQSWDETVDELQKRFYDLQKALQTVSAEMKIYNRVMEWAKGRTKDYAFHTTQMEEWIARDKAESK